MRGAFSAALLVSIGLHGLGFGIFTDRQEVEIQGGSPAVAARLGSSFADMVSGRAMPVEAVMAKTPTVEAHVAQTPPALTEPRQSTQTATPAPPEMQSAVDPETEAPTPVEEPSEAVRPPSAAAPAGIQPRPHIAE